MFIFSSALHLTGNQLQSLISLAVKGLTQSTAITF